MWYTYILESQKNKRLYVGYTNDLRRRFREHNSGIGGQHTRNNRPFKLIFYEAFLEKEDACRAEKFFKSGYGKEILKNDKIKIYLSKHMKNFNMILLLFIFSIIPFKLSGATTVAPGDLIKINGISSVYLLGPDSQRYVFPNEKVYKTWYNDFSKVITITEQEMVSYTIGGNITYKPGVRLVKISTDPKVYAVSGYGVSGYATLHWVVSEKVARELYGSDWVSYVDDVQDIFFGDYIVEDDITKLDDYNRESGMSTTITLFSNSPFINFHLYQSYLIDTYCVVDTDCKSLDTCDAGCWNIDYVPSPRPSGTACPAVQGPETCVCNQNKCTDSRNL